MTMPKYNTTLNEDSYSLEIPYAEHVKFMDIIDKTIEVLTTDRTTLLDLNRKLDEYLKNKEISEELYETLKKQNKYNIKSLEDKLDMADNIIRSVENI
jgi:hypothetical protein